MSNPQPVILVDQTGAYVGPGGGGGTTSTNLTQVGSQSISLGQDTNGNASVPVVLPSGLTIGVSGTVTASGSVALLAGSAIVGQVGIDQTTDGTTNAVHLKAGTAIAGKFGIDQTTPGTTNAVQLVPGTTGGLSLLSTLHGNNVTAVVVKASAGQLYAIAATNNSSVYGYLKIYNATSATAGSGTPVDRILIPAPAAGGGGGIVWSVPAGVAYSTGITYCLTGLVADNDTTAPAASSFTVTFYFK